MVFIGMKLSIIIPCKNEEKYLGKLFESLRQQYLPKDTEIIIADAGSTDRTIKIIDAYSRVLPLKVVNGGLPSVGRNNGARVSNGDILLFLDADCYFKSKTIILESYLNIKKGKELVGGLLNIEDDFKVRVMYFFSNMIVRLSKLDSPFVVGGFFMIKKDVFDRLGGFDETMMHCEDYFLSKQVSRKNFAIVNKYVYTDNRRFNKIGYFGLMIYFINNIIKRNDKEFFKKDIGYWK
jgi:glycosyltransferase involved in cell wall biosynthesis